MDNVKRAREIIQELLNLALNRHIHVLSDAGYLKSKKHQNDYGYEDGTPLPALELKHQLIEEMCRRFEPAIADYLEYPRAALWPVHDAETVRARINQNFPGGTL